MKLTPTLYIDCIGHAIQEVQKGVITLTLTEGTVPSESIVTDTVESSSHIRTGGTLTQLCVIS